jgi:hypothetical protein
MQSINLDDSSVHNSILLGKRIQLLANKLNSYILKTHKCTFMNGGCLIFAEAVQNIYSNNNYKTELCVVGRRDNIDHIIIKIISNEKEFYIDADGIGNKQNLIDKMIFLEQLPDNIIIRNLSDTNIDKFYGIQDNRKEITNTRKVIIKELKELFNKYGYMI